MLTNEEYFNGDDPTPADNGKNLDGDDSLPKEYKGGHILPSMDNGPIIGTEEYLKG